MEREFNYSKKENYTQADMDAILGQHKTFVGGGFKGFVSAEDNQKVLDELKPYKAATRTKHIMGVVKGLTDTDTKLSDAVNLAKITEDDDDASIKSKVEEVIKGRKHLQIKEETSAEMQNDKNKKVKQEKEDKFSDL